MSPTEAHYRRYLAHLNDRKLDLGEFVQDHLTYNGRAMTRKDYQDLIAGDVAAIPGLLFDVQLLVIDGDQIACRLHFRCTPLAEFLGLQPTGKSVDFAEHVFYRLHDGKIAEVWSLIDRAAIERQLAG